MDLDWLKDFLALAEEKNFSRAADARHVTQPAFSRRIRALEDWTGTALFERSAQGATLTPAGAHFRPHAEELMRALRRAQRETRAVGTGETASLSIAATHALSFTFFPGWVRKHVRLEALGTLNLISDSMEACEDIMLAGEVDFLLCHITLARRPVSIPSGFKALRWGPTPSFRLARPTQKVTLSGRSYPIRRDKRGCSLTAKHRGSAGYWPLIKSREVRPWVRKPYSHRIMRRR